VAVAVFDADVLIAYLGKDDANHVDAVRRVRQALEPGTRRLVSVVNYSEILIGPLRRRGAVEAATVDSMLDDLGIEIVPADRAIAGEAAAVRVQTGLKLPDAYALATALAASNKPGGEVRLESFDVRVVKAYGALAPRPPDSR
jgi:predicted nucleic acid-binding protein